MLMNVVVAVSSIVPLVRIKELKVLVPLRRQRRWSTVASVPSVMRQFRPGMFWCAGWVGELIVKVV